MKRLTKHNRIGKPVLRVMDECPRCGEVIWGLNDLGYGNPIERLAAYEDTGLTPARCAELAKADQEGRLHISPVALGGTTYSALRDNEVGNFELLTDCEKVTGLAIKEDGWYAITDGDFYKIGSSYAALSAEEAEKALEREGE